MAESERFELPDPFGPLVFKTDALGLSATSANTIYTSLETTMSSIFTPSTVANIMRLSKDGRFCPLIHLYTGYGEAPEARLIEAEGTEAEGLTEALISGAVLGSPDESAVAEEATEEENRRARLPRACR